MLESISFICFCTSIVLFLRNLDIYAAFLEFEVSSSTSSVIFSLLFTLFSLYVPSPPMSES